MGRNQKEKHGNIYMEVKIKREPKQVYENQEKLTERKIITKDKESHFILL